VGHLLPAAAAQLHRASPHPFRAPAFELHYPHLVEQFRHEAHVGGKADQFEAAARAQEGEQSPNGDPKSR
jgi:hypothetical protein